MNRISPSVIKDISWIKEKERDIDISLMSFYLIGQNREYFKIMGADTEVKNQLAFGSGKLYFDKKEIEDAKEYVLSIDNLVDWSRDLVKIFLEFTEQCEKAISHTPSINEFRKFSQEELISWYEAHTKSILFSVPYSFIVSMILESVIRDIVVKELGKENDDPEKIYQDIVVAKKQNETSLEYTERLKLACLYEKFGGENFSKKANKEIALYLKRFCWLHYYRPVDTPIIEETLIKMIQDIALNKNPEEELLRMENKPDSYQEATKLLTELNLTEKTHSLIEFMQENVWVRTYRRELMSRAFYFAEDFYLVVAERVGAQYEDFKNIAYWEVADIIRENKMIDKAELERRNKNFLLLKYNNDVSIISGDEVDLYNLKEKALPSVKELKGRMVFPGRVSGSVKIVRSSDDAKTFKAGDILVAPTVAVWMTSVVEKCSGIITDSGGVLSHTAIVAREFHKPCIVGTTHATEVLKNDMIITLDANQGLITLNNK